MCTLNQFVITPADQDLAQKLVEIYFTFFKVSPDTLHLTAVCDGSWCQVYSSKEELDAKMLAALLTGVNRAFPFVRGKYNERH